MTATPLSHRIIASRMPAAGRRFEIEAEESERRALAGALGIEDVTALKAELYVRSLGAAAVGVKGTLTASVVQTDVVTLEPLPQVVEEEIDLILVPAERASEIGGPQPDRLGEAAERDTYENDRIDLGAIVAEHLALGLDPYPRAPGSAFSDHVEGAPAAKTSPFAALASLKRKPE